MLWSGDEPTALFLDSIDRWVDAMVADEHGGGRGPKGLVDAKIVAKASGVLCGRVVADRLLERHFSQCSAQWLSDDGDEITSGDTIALLDGPAESLLRMERTMLNIVGRLSGIATNTAEWSRSAEPIRVAATRKTEWGLLDKWAVHIGGGLTHRLNRSDVVMLKENDIVAASRNGEDSVATIRFLIGEIWAPQWREHWSQRREDYNVPNWTPMVEVRDTEEVLAAAAAWDVPGGEKIVLLVDNTGPSGIKEVIRALSEGGLRERCVLEGSGGVTLDSLAEWSPSGVDLVSSSALNLGVPPLDLSMLIGGGE
jgi:nicotinate-nucleotide pyrophosphorylase (carboxylating)